MRTKWKKKYRRCEKVKTTTAAIINTNGKCEQKAKTENEEGEREWERRTRNRTQKFKHGIAKVTIISTIISRNYCIKSLYTIVGWCIHFRSTIVVIVQFSWQFFFLSFALTLCSAILLFTICSYILWWENLLYPRKKWRKKEVFFVYESKYITRKKTKSKNENRLNKIIQMGFNVADTQMMWWE